jgi:hypothetical protein
MLVLTCRVGATIRIGEEIHVTLQSRLRNRVTVGVIAPAEAAVMLDRACLQPVVMPSGTSWYLFSLLGVRRFRVGHVEVGMWVPGEKVSLASDFDDFIHVGVIAPPPMRIGYEQACTGPTSLSVPSRSTMTNHWH